MGSRTKLPIKKFSSHPGALAAVPNLVEIQTRSYAWLLKQGVRELFDEISPIRDFTGKDLSLAFLDYRFDEPKYDEAHAKLKDLTYEAPLRARLRLEIQKLGTVREQEVYLGDFPMMTDRGTFIVNGVERVVVSQLIRSAGSYFTANVLRGRKLFGAKVIPNRGAWLEFETDVDGTVAVKIDRSRKVPVTSLLRVFSLTSDEAILDAVRAISPEAVPTVAITLKKDSAKREEDAYVEIYKRLRPGDLASLDNMKTLIHGMFGRADRYDLSAVGRFKLNQRLVPGKKDAEKSHLLVADDLVRIIAEMVRLNADQSAEPDDIDHLGNRRVRPVGELLENRLRIGLARMRRIVQDRMSTLDLTTLTPVQLVNIRPLLSVVKEFFSSSQLSQFMDQVNPLAEVEHKRRISAMGPGGLARQRAGFEVRDVHRSHYGRICPIQTPEGQNIGLINYLSVFTRVSDLGFLETPYAVVRDGRVTDEIVWLNALEEERHKIAHAGVPLDADWRIAREEVEARVRGEPGICRRDEVDLIDVAPNQALSVATSLIPFLEHDDANRASMGSNMQRQAVSPIRPEAPLVGTGLEEKTARDSGYLVLAPEEGTIVGLSANHVAMKGKSGANLRFPLATFKRSNQFTCISQRPTVSKDERVKRGEVLADGPSTDGGVLGLGQNLLAAFVSWEGANFEDAIVLSERVVQWDRFTSIHIENYDCDVRDTKLGPELTTPDISNVSEEKLKNLDEEGIVRIGAEVRAGDILVGKISPKGESDLTSEERLLRAIFGEKAREVKDASLTLPHGKYGRVVGVKIFSRDHGDKLEPGIIRRIQVEIAQLRKAQAGDKLAGRHGNKGVISQVRPVEDMPYLEDGTPVDIVLNPLGVASRMNLGQILETHLGWAAQKLGYRAVTPVLAGATEAQIEAELVAAGIPPDGKVTLYDGRTGRSFAQRVTVGVIYVMKLNHLVEDKLHMRSIGPYSLITKQPLGGKAQFGGQRFGEMEVWALEGYGAAHTLQEMLTTKSDDIVGRSAAYEAIIRGEPIRTPNIPASFNVLVSELKSLGLSVELLSGGKVVEESVPPRKQTPARKR